jgi:hypothetical protein
MGFGNSVRQSGHGRGHGSINVLSSTLADLTREAVTSKRRLEDVLGELTKVQLQVSHRPN